MSNGLVIADAGPIFSLALIDKLDVLDKLFDDTRISKAVFLIDNHEQPINHTQ